MYDFRWLVDNMLETCGIFRDTSAPFRVKRPYDKLQSDHLHVEDSWPESDKTARDLMAAAYQIATKSDPNVTTILIEVVSARNKKPCPEKLT